VAFCPLNSVAEVADPAGITDAGYNKRKRPLANQRAQF
jgi:hypothetical protein